MEAWLVVARLDNFCTSDERSRGVKCNNSKQVTGPGREGDREGSLKKVTGATKKCVELDSVRFCFLLFTYHSVLQTTTILHDPTKIYLEFVQVHLSNSCPGSVLERLRGTRAIPRPTERAFPAKFPNDF